MMGEDFEHWYEVGRDAIAYGNHEFGNRVMELLEDEAAARGLDGLPDSMG